MRNPFRKALPPLAAALALTFSTARVLAAPPPDPAALDRQEAQAAALLDRGDLASAAPILERAFAARVDALAPGDVNGGGPLGARFLMACRNAPPDACHDRIVAPALALLEKRLGGADMRLAEALEAVGDAYLIPVGPALPAPPMITRARRLLEHALDVREKALGTMDILLVDLPLQLVRACLLQSDFAAIAALEERLGARLDHDASALFGAGDEQLQRYGAGYTVNAVDQALSLHLRVVPTSPELGREALATLLRFKGRLADTQADLLSFARTSADPELKRLVADHAKVTGQLASEAMRAPGQEGLYRPLALAAQKDAAAIASRVARLRPGGPRAIPSIEAIRAGLGEGEALVELAVHRPVEKDFLTLGPLDDDDDAPLPSPRYAAYVLAKDGSIRGVDLGDAPAIDAAAAKLREALGDEKIDPAPAARALDALTMAKIRPLAGGARRLLVSPDGALSTIPFAALVDEQGHYLLEGWSFRYLDSGRDVLHAARRRSREGPVALGDPDFGAARPGAAQGDRGMRATELTGVVFPPLPGTGEEAVSVSALLPSARPLLHARASETALKALRGPSILHLATHGFFQQDASVSLDLHDVQSLGLLADPAKTPMLRAGLALAGANRAAVSGNDDGVLTALEASSLDLSGTRLVVLSACETGLGDPSAGEGVYGLRRALVMAGAETLVMSLWRVPDESTRDLMKAFYVELRAGAVPSEAMRKVSLAMLADGRAHKTTSLRAHPRFWASFIVSGDDVPLGEVWQAPAPPVAAAPGSHTCGCSLPGASPPSAAPALALGIALSLRRLRRRRRRAGRSASSPAG